MRDAQQAKLSAQVRESVARMDAQPSGSRGNETERALNELVALGPDATPLLLPYLDPGANATDHDRARATRCAQALSRMDTTPITEKLLGMLPSATDEGKKNALLVLETTRERARVEPRLYEAFKSAQGPLKLTSCARCSPSAAPRTRRSCRRCCSATTSSRPSSRSRR
jgi:hypothetical protein